MTAIDVAKAQMESDTECLNCGREVCATEDVEYCEVCCPHDHVEDAGLLGMECTDCGLQVEESEDGGWVNTGAYE